MVDPDGGSQATSNNSMNQLVAGDLRRQRKNDVLPW
jgi:hypothetical protein